MQRRRVRGWKSEVQYIVLYSDTNSMSRYLEGGRLKYFDESILTGF